MEIAIAKGHRGLCGFKCDASSGRIIDGDAQAKISACVRDTFGSFYLADDGNWEAITRPMT